MKEAAEKKKLKWLNELVHKAILASCTSGYYHSLKEIMSDKAVQEKISGVGVLEEQGILDEFFEKLRVDEDSVCYGLNTVKIVLEAQAASVLLISDNLFRSLNTQTR